MSVIDIINRLARRIERMKGDVNVSPNSRNVLEHDHVEEIGNRGLLRISYGKDLPPAPYEHTFVVNGKSYTVDVRKVNVSEEYLTDIDRELKKLKAENREWEEQFSILIRYQNNGIDLEKQKDLDGAISEYEQAIAYGKTASRMTAHNYQYSVGRLMILYRKKKDYDRELALIKEILGNDLPETDREKFKDRLERATLLKFLTA